MIGLRFADHAQLKKDGRNFDCGTCMAAVQKLRRCKEERDNFTRADGPLWPMPIQKGGRGFGFCPGKATWSSEAAELMSILELTHITRTLFYPGSISEQPAWYVELIKDLLPQYEGHKSAQRHNSMWGGSSSKPTKGGQPKTRTPKRGRR